MAAYDLDRFKQAQASCYPTVLAELAGGQKRTHWMWYIFPQIDGLGRSAKAKLYAIANIEEAQAYLADPLLGGRLLECAQTLLGQTARDAESIFGYIDSMKLRSSMTLFEAAGAGDEHWAPFGQVLDAFYRGKRDEATLDKLAQQHAAERRFTS
ncbi:MAG: DUF1810 domain-containing protein [Coriobacteriaceae bacterium]|nr:DUF1810 domain-containing protein [Coriobacteriaceae bacterium]